MGYNKLISMETLLTLKGPLRLDIVGLVRGAGTNVIHLCGKEKCGNGWVSDKSRYE
jgi:hypothetical protein